MGSTNGMAEQLRAQLDAPGYIELPGCHDVLSAMVLEHVGFKAVFLSGYGVAASMLGNPDIGLTTLSETALMARNLVNRLRVPLVVDADNGYGNEDNVIRTINELEAAGVAAIVMEDQVLPKRCGHTADKKILPLSLYMQKLEWALKARRTPMVIVARTDSMNLDDAIMRARTFREAGADVTLIDGLRSVESINRVATEVPGHKQINLIYGGVTPLYTTPKLHELGFKIILYSTPTLYVAAHAMWKSLTRLAEAHDINVISDDSIPFKSFQKFIEERYAQLVGAAATKP